MKVTEELLMESGYKKIRHPYLNSDTHTYFQKRFRDENGSTKYFIEADHMMLKDVSLYEFKIQLNPKEYDTIGVTTVQWFNNDQEYSTMTLEKVEELFEKLFVSLNCIKYDD